MRSAPPTLLSSLLSSRLSNIYFLSIVYTSLIIYVDGLYYQDMFFDMKVVIMRVIPPGTSTAGQDVVTQGTHCKGEIRIYEM
jgi:hypothetical protein